MNPLQPLQLFPLHMFPCGNGVFGRLAANRLAASLAIVATLFSVPAARAANIQDNVLSGATDLGNTASATTYQTPPTTTSDVTFAPNTTYTGLTITSGPLSIGTLNDVDVQAVAISGATQTLTLAAGGSNSVAPAYGGSAADVLFVAAGAKLTLADTGGITLAGAGTIDVQGQLNLTGTPLTLNGNLTVLSTASVGALTIASAAFGALSGTGNITINNNQNPLQNNLPVNASVANTVEFTAASAFTGSVDIQQGIVSVNASNALGGVANTITLGDVGSATLDATQNLATTVANNIISAGSGTNILANSSGTSSVIDTFSGSVTLNNNLTLTSTVPNSQILLTNTVSGTGGLNVVNVLAELTGASTYTGATTVNNATLNIGNSTATGSVTGSALALNAGILLFSTTGTNTETFTGTTLSSGSSFINSTVSTDTLALGTITHTTGATVDFNSNNSSSYSGAVTFANSLTNGILGPWATYGGIKNATNANGVRYATITGGKAAPYTGTTANLPSNLTSSATTNFELVNGSATGLTGSVTANTIRFGNTSTVGTLDLGGNTLTLNGLLDDGGVAMTVQNGTLAIGSSNELDIVGPVSTTISASIVDNGATPSTLTCSSYNSSTLTLSGANTYSGGTFVNYGTLKMGGSSALGASTGSLTVNPTTSLDLNGNSITVGALNGLSGTNSGGLNQTATITNTSTTPVTLTVGSGGGSGMYSGIVTAGTGAGTIALVKTGTGTEVLSSSTSNAYTGGTTVNGGTLSGDTISYSSGAVTANSSGTADYTIGQDRTYTPNIGGAGFVTIHAIGHTLTYAGVDSASGGTTVSSGTLLLNKSGAAALTGPVGVATGATVGLGANNELASTSNVTLTGGKLAANGHNDAVIVDSTHATSGLGTLTISDNPTHQASLLDFGDPTGTANSSNGVILAFADSSSLALSWTGTVQIVNANGTKDQLYIGTSADLTPGQLAAITFNGVPAQQLSTGQIVFAPEPSGWASMLIGIGVLGGFVARRRKTAYAS